jgi:MEDS: MEthanogen/methylotroph, DcmR Sensory domain
MARANSETLNSYSLADPKSSLPRIKRSSNELEEGKHIFYLFNNAEEKQRKIFRILESLLSGSRTSILYIAGKQGVKGIRLSLKDFGIDVALHEKQKKFKIVDSEEWFLTKARQPTFKPFDEICADFDHIGALAKTFGFDFATIISETDMLVRKGFAEQYISFEKEIGGLARKGSLAFLCAYDEREILARGLKSVPEEVTSLHAGSVSS